MPPRQRTGPPGAIYESAAAFQDDLDAGVAAAEERMVAAYWKSYDNARDDLQKLLDKIHAARVAGEELSPAWLYQYERLANTLATVERELDRFTGTAVELTEQAQILGAQHGASSAQALVSQAVPVNLSASFVQVNEANARAAVGFLADGSPLSALLQPLAAETAEQIRDTLVEGVLRGKGIPWMARRVTESLDMPRHRAVTIMRTEAQRSFRAVAGETYQANAEVLEGWVWHAKLSATTCAACLAMHGTLHPLTETLDGHPRCRCAMVPRTKSWADLGLDDMPDTRPPLEDGRDWLAAQPERTQRAILGPAKLKAWKDGRITLDDVVARTRSREWGTMRRERSLIEIDEGRNANTLPEGARR